jgi:hypothetical protein
VGSHAANTKWWLEHLEAVVKLSPLGCDAEITGSSKTLINFYQTAHRTKHYVHSDGRESDGHQAKYKWRYDLSWRMMVSYLIWADDLFTPMIEVAGSSETSLHLTDDMKSHRRTRGSKTF